MFKLAMVQMLVEGAQPEANRDRAQQRIATAAKAGAQVIVLPECMDVGWTHPETPRLAGTVPDGPTCTMLRQAARDHGVYVCSGLVERARDEVFNSAVLIGPDGDVLLLHRKLNELGIGHPFNGQGDRLGGAHTPLGCLGLMICADGFARDRVISRTLGYMGADVILSPSAWAVPPGHDNQATPYGQEWVDWYGPVAKDFRIFIAGISNVGRISAGPWEGWDCIGCSLLVGPNGQQLMNGRYGINADMILYADIEPVARPARGCGWGEVWDGASTGGG